jgi:hypothetical protein
MKASIVIYAALAVAAQALPQGAPKAAQPPPTQSSPQTTEIQTAAPYSPYLPMAGFAAAIANIVAFLYPGYVAGAQPIGGAYPPLPNGPPVSGTAFGV